MSEEIRWRVPKARLFTAPIPMETRTYKPVSHRQLSDVTLEAIHKAGFKLDKHEYNSTSEGMIANARYTISDVADSEMQLEIGWQNSYNKTLSLKFAIGTRIFICDNGCVSGDMGAFASKHMGEIREFAPIRIAEAIKHSGETFKKIQEQRDIMKEIEIDRQVQAELVGRLFLEEEMINSNQINIIRNELKSPSFDYGCPNSLWELYNHTTLSMKNLHPRLWMENHIKVHKFFTSAIIERPIISVDVRSEITDPAQVNLYEAIDEVNA